jgi:TP901 family phage tail tape measure protein
MAGSKTERELAFLLTGKDVSASKAMKGVNREVVSLQKHAGKAGRNIGRNIEKGVLVGGAAAVGALGYAIKTAIDFESAIAGVAKTVDGDITAIVDGLKEMSGALPTSFEDLAAIAEAGGALGVAKDDILDFTHTVALLAETTDLSSDAAATSLGKLRTTLKLTGPDFKEFGDILVHLGNNGASTESEILAMAESIAGAADVVGASKEQVLAWSSAMANTGEAAEAGGSSIQRFWLGSFKHVQKGGKELKLMAKTAGMTAAEFKKAFGKDATGTLHLFLTELGKLDKAAQLATLEKLGFKDIRIQRALLKLLANTDNLTQSLGDADEAAGKMGEEAEKRFATTAAQIGILQNNVKLAAAMIGEELLPVVNELAKEGIDWIRDNQPAIKKFAKDLGVGFRDAVAYLKSLDWDAIGAAIQAGAEGAKALVNAFMGLPPEVKALLAGAYGANKITGGVVVDIAGDVFKQFAGRGSSPANPLWVTSVGGAIGGPAGAGGGLMGALGGGGTAASRLLRIGGGAVLGLGGSALMGAGLERQDMGSKVGGAVGGAAGMIAGGAMILGPIGAIAGSIAAVAQTQQTISGQNSEMARALSGTLDTRVSSSPPIAELKYMLAAVDQGIADITSNPLLTLVQGDALAELRAMKEKLQGQITEQQATSHYGYVTAQAAQNMVTAAHENQQAAFAIRDRVDAVVTGTQRLKDDTVSAINLSAADQAIVTAAQTREIGVAKQAQIAAIARDEAAVRAAGVVMAAATRAIGNQISTAIRVNRAVVNVSPTTIQRTTVVQSRTGSSSGSREKL